MGNLFDGVHACVGAPGANQLYRVIGDKSKRFLEVLLNRAAVRLPLPAAIGTPRVLDPESVFHRHPTPSASAAADIGQRISRAVKGGKVKTIDALFDEQRSLANCKLR
jgi:hypothetical protein